MVLIGPIFSYYQPFQTDIWHTLIRKGFLQHGEGFYHVGKKTPKHLMGYL